MDGIEEYFEQVLEDKVEPKYPEGIDSARDFAEFGEALAAGFKEGLEDEDSRDPFTG